MNQYSTIIINYSIKLIKLYQGLLMKLNPSKNNHKGTISREASQISHEYLASIRKSLDKMERILCEKQNQIIHDYKNNKINPQDPRRHSRYLNGFQNKKLIQGIFIQQSLRDSRDRYHNPGYQPGFQKIEPKYQEYNNYFSEKSHKRNSPIQRKGVNLRNADSVTNLNDFVNVSSKRQKQFVFIQDQIDEQENTLLPKDKQNSNFNSYVKQALENSDNVSKIKEDKNKQVYRYQNQSQSNIEMENLIFQPTFLRKNTQQIFDSKIKKPSHNYTFYSSNQKQPSLSYQRTGQPQNIETPKSLKLRKIFNKKRSKSRKIFDKTASKIINCSYESLQLTDSRNNNDKLPISDKNIKIDYQKISPTQEIEKIKTLGSQKNRSKTQKIENNQNLMKDQKSEHSTYRNTFLYHNFMNQESVARENNQIELNPQFFLKKVNKCIKSQAEAKHLRIKQSKPFIKPHNIENKTFILKKVLIRKNQDLHSSLSPKGKNMNKELYYDSRNKSPWPKHSKYQQVSEGQLFKMQLKRQYNFVQKHFTDKQLEEIYQRLCKANIPKPNWLRQVFQEIRRKQLL